MQKKVPLQTIADSGDVLKREILSFYRLTDPDQLALLTVTCAALDRFFAARGILERDGLVVVDRLGGKKPHPAVQIESAARGQFLTGMMALKLDDIPRGASGKPIDMMEFLGK